MLKAWAEDDHPRDENGRFTSHGTTAAGAASKKAHKDKSETAHQEAARTHSTAEEKHKKEEPRRLTLSRKRSLSKEARERHKKAAERHRKAAVEHAKLADYHRKEATAAARKGAIAHSTKTSVANTKASHKAVAKMKIGAYLETSPLKSLQEHGEGHVWNHATGIYDSTRGVISLQNDTELAKSFEVFQRHNKQWAKKAKALGDPNLFTNTSRATSKEDLAEITMVHELSHHMHMDRENPLPLDLYNEIRSSYRERVGRDESSREVVAHRWVATTYATANEFEWFAETHTAYIYDPKAVEKNDPQAFALMRRVRKARGLDD